MSALTASGSSPLAMRSVDWRIASNSAMNSATSLSAQPDAFEMRCTRGQALSVSSMSSSMSCGFARSSSDIAPTIVSCSANFSSVSLTCWSVSVPGMPGTLPLNCLNVRPILRKSSNVTSPVRARLSRSVIAPASARAAARPAATSESAPVRGPSSVSPDSALAASWKPPKSCLNIAPPSELGSSSSDARSRVGGRFVGRAAGRTRVTGTSASVARSATQAATMQQRDMLQGVVLRGLM
mmetsp:Transcript_34597/g.106965  ORF Transcript_34597/g.106965 Transcript_34597/m.106965 type:complete len:239 (-) Transcript_34597:138-854(-)